MCYKGNLLHRWVFSKYSRSWWQKSICEITKVLWGRLPRKKIRKKCCLCVMLCVMCICMCMCYVMCYVCSFSFPTAAAAMCYVLCYVYMYMYVYVLCYVLCVFFLFSDCRCCYVLPSTVSVSAGMDNSTKADSLATNQTNQCTTIDKDKTRIRRGYEHIISFIDWITFLDNTKKTG